MPSRNTSFYRCTAVQCPPYTIERITVDSWDFEAVLNLRAAAYGRSMAGEPDAVDGYSLHFIAKSKSEILGATRVTCRQHGSLESEEHYPRWLLQEYGDRMCATSRLCVIPTLIGRSSVPVGLTAFAWKTILPLGVRIDVSKARLEAVPYYMRMGCLFVRDSHFMFDRWSALCGLIACPANIKHRSKMSYLFANISDPCELDASVNTSPFVASYQEFLITSKAVSQVTARPRLSTER